MFGRVVVVVAAALCGAARAKLSPQWQVVSDARGVTTRARVDRETSLCAVHGEAVVDLSLARLMAVFTNLSHYEAWDETCVAAREWTGPDGSEFQYQKFKQPWPVADRELVVRRTRHLAANAVAFQFDSVDDGTPVARGATRTFAKRVWWNFTAVSETETLISHYSCVDPGGAIPGWARDAIVQRWCQSQIVALVDTAKRLALPPVAAFLGWGAPTARELAALAAATRDCAPAADDARAARAVTPAPRPPGAPFEFEP